MRDLPIRDKQGQPLDWPGGAFAGASLWSMLTVFLGLLLWAQIFSLPFLEELRFSDQSTSVALSYMIPLIALVPGALFRVPALNLLVFPVCFIPGMLTLPERSLLELEQGWSMLRIGISVAAYVAVAAAGASKEQTVGKVEPMPDRHPQKVAGLYPMYFATRCLILMALLLVSQYAAFQDPTIAAKIAEHYGERPEAAATFLGLFSFFAWSVAAYTMFFVPLMNLEYDVRKLSRSVDSMADSTPRARWLRIGAWALVAAGTTAAAWLFT
jgi:hypothetical protein